MTKYIKDILIYKTSGKLEIYSEAEIEQIRELSDKVTKERLIKLIYTLSELENSMKWSSQKSILFQAGILGLCDQKDAADIGTLADRIAKLENSLKDIKSGTGVSAEVSDSVQPQKTAKTAQATNSKSPDPIEPDEGKGTSHTKKQDAKKGIPGDCNLQDYWGDIINKFKSNGKIMLYTNLLNTRAVQLNDMTVGIEFPSGLTSFGRTVLEKTESINEISKLVSSACGKEMRIKYIDTKEDAAKNNASGIEDLAKELDLPINVIDE